MNIFVTGVTGFIGKALLSRLLAVIGPADRIFALTRREVQFDDERVVRLIGTLEEIERFRDDIVKSDYVFHLAANPAFGNRADYDAVNYDPVVRLVNMLKGSGFLKNFIFISTIGAVDRAKGDSCAKPLTINSKPSPTSCYGSSKLKAENYLMNSGIPYTIIRPGWVYGKNMRAKSHINVFVSLVYRNSFAIRFRFPGKVSLLHVDDLAYALVNGLGNHKILNKVYFAETEALPIGKIFSIIYSKINKKPLVQIPVPSFSFVLGKIHSCLPLAVANLFLSYLWAQDKDFRSDFSLHEAKSFHDYAHDAISANPHNGYWVITGANSGIGYALAKRLDSLRRKLILIDKVVDSLGAFKEHIVLKADLSNIDELGVLAKKIGGRTICCLINNAGVGYRGGVKDLDIGRISETVEVNICYPVFFTKFLLDELIRSGSTIVNIASSVAYNPLPHMSVYSASKAFMMNWSESLTYELRETNNVITFSPAGTSTHFQKNAGVRVLHGGKGLLSPEYVAQRIVKAVYGNESVVVMGLGTKILLFVSHLLPRRLNIFLWGKMFERLR